MVNFQIWYVFVLTIYAPDNIQTVGGASAQSQDHHCDMGNLTLYTL